MLEIKKTYVTDSKKRPVAVQVDIQTFEKMEQLLEDYALGQFIGENDSDDVLSVAEAKAYYESLVQKKTEMNIQVNRVFLKELAKLPLRKRLKVEKLLFEEVESYKSLAQIPNFKKLKGYRNFYKIRFGDYRAGLKFENNTLYFERILHRKEIYKFYP